MCCRRTCRRPLIMRDSNVPLSIFAALFFLDQEHVDRLHRSTRSFFPEPSAMCRYSRVKTRLVCFPWSFRNTVLFQKTPSLVSCCEPQFCIWRLLSLCSICSWRTSRPSSLSALQFMSYFEIIRNRTKKYSCLTRYICTLLNYRQIRIELIKHDWCKYWKSAM